MVKITLVRHGESTDNLKHVWGGWNDAPLTQHGMRQAEALALAFASIPLSAIYTSDLRRASLTARAIQAAQPAPNCPSPPSGLTSSTPTSDNKSASKTANPLVPLTVTNLLREQYFGTAEGQSYQAKRQAGLTLAQHYAKGIFPTIYNRSGRFPGGESKDDVKDRAVAFYREFLLQWLVAEAEGQPSCTHTSHVVIVSHGLFILELAAMLLERDPVWSSEAREEIRRNMAGMKNTSWSRLDISFRTPSESEEGLEQSEVGSRPLKVGLIRVNACPHLDQLKRLKGGLARAAHDPAQTDIRSFFAK